MFVGSNAQRKLAYDLLQQFGSVDLVAEAMSIPSESVQALVFTGLSLDEFDQTADEPTDAEVLRRLYDNSTQIIIGHAVEEVELSTNERSVWDPGAIAFEWLSNEGFRPSRQADGPVRFKAQGYESTIRLPEDAIALSIFLTISNEDGADEDDEEIEDLDAIRLANTINRENWLVCCYFTRRGCLVIERSHPIETDEDIEEFLDVAINQLLDIIDNYRSSIKEL